MAFSAPGPCCMQKAPMLRPEVTREIASAMWMPMRSCRTITGPDIGGGGMFDQVIDRIAAEDLDPFALHDFCDGGAEFHGRILPWTGRC